MPISWKVQGEAFVYTVRRDQVKIDDMTGNSFILTADEIDIVCKELAELKSTLMNF